MEMNGYGSSRLSCLSASLRPTLVDPRIIHGISSRSSMLSDILLERDLDERFFKVLGAQRGVCVMGHDFS